MTSRESRRPTGMQPVGGRTCPIRNLCPLPSRPWTAFFLSPEGVQSSFVSGRASSSNPKAWCPPGVILSCSRFLPTLDMPGEAAVLPSRPVSRAAVFTPRLRRSACANSLPSGFFTSYLCPNVWELHWDVYICLSEEPRK